MKNYAKFILKKHFFETFKFFIDIITPVISFTQIACDVMYVLNVIQ